MDKPKKTVHHQSNIMNFNKENGNDKSFDHQQLEGNTQRRPLQSANSQDQIPLTHKNPKDQSSKAERQEIFIPVSGFVWLYPEEIIIINLFFVFNF